MSISEESANLWYLPNSYAWLLSTCELRNVPRRSERSFINAKKTGTRIRTWIVEVIIPPTIGAAIGFIKSDPTPVSQRIGIKLASTTQTVINFGLRRRGNTDHTH